ncbi:hypothetical protein RKE25_07330 [Dyella sp. BiH032]|uniref:hypothetical protein n=1 Tax=Dyella sp. BiH032 TaxID=3075430 RepID=UPI00289362E5|nr:hypothetical protein [Dyella sp. BiH032]WNL47435.1 hypothetical protein RKE25_07330 [Dyella sp. BiH032]
MKLNDFGFFSCGLDRNSKFAERESKVCCPGFVDRRTRATDYLEIALRESRKSPE